MINIKILGIGGAINVGLPYNAFIIDGTFLCEAPPDIMPSLLQNGIDISSIHIVFVSHLHGDHTFGLPFFLLSSWFLYDRDHKQASITIIGPQGIENHAKELLTSAFTADHPCLAWMKTACNFLEINESSQPDLLPGWKTGLFKLNHRVETYGFSLTQPGGKMAFAYIADTLWCDSIQALLSHCPELVLVDLNGQADDTVAVHLSIADLQARALPITGTRTQYYGTHVKQEFQDIGPCIKCAKPGMVISSSKSA